MRAAPKCLGGREVVDRQRLDRCCRGSWAGPAVELPADRRAPGQHRQDGAADPARPRHPGPPPRPDTRVDPRLTAQYGDLETTALLRRYRIPRRHRPGGITDRFPTPARITPGFLRAAYLDIGLAPGTSSNSLTGHPAEQVLDLLHQHRIPVRSAGGHSPGYRRQHHHPR